MPVDKATLAWYLQKPNVQAFLRLIRAGESSQGDEAYRMRWGGTGQPVAYFDDFSKHPKIFAPGPNGLSSAAGAYQITWTTYKDLSQWLGITSFMPEDQDLMAVALIERAGALDDVLRGDVVQAINKLGGTWASLPSSEYGQPTVSLKRLLDVYTRYGGMLYTQAPEATQPAAEAPPPPPSAPAAEPASFPPFDFGGGEGGRAGAENPAAPWPYKPQPLPEAKMLPAIAWSLAYEAAKSVSAVAKILFDPAKPVPQRNTEVVGEVLGAIVRATKPADVPNEVWNEQRAVEAVANDPALAARAQAALLADMDRLMGVVARGTEIDDASRDRAATRAKTDTWDPMAYLIERNERIMYVALGMLGLSVIAAFWFKVGDAYVGLIVGAFVSTLTIVVAEWRRPREYRFGSSSGSKASGDAVRALVESRK